MTLQDSFKDKFALVIDLRTINDNFVHGNGKKTCKHSIWTFTGS